MRLFHLLALCIFACCVTVSAQIPAKRYSPDFTSSDPYGLANADLDHFASPGYPHANAGVLMSRGAVQSSLLQLAITPLSTNVNEFALASDASPTTRHVAPFTSILLGLGTVEPAFPGGQYLFLQAGISPLFGLRFPTLSPSGTLNLVRRYHFPSSLVDDLSGAPLSPANKKLIVLIHGWNPESDDDSYNNPNYDRTVTDKQTTAYDDHELIELKWSLRNVLAGAPDWALVLYHWEKDADTGGGVSAVGAVDAAINGSEAAEAGYRHGQHLGQILSESPLQNIEKVQFIAHSAGSWVARGAVKYLLAHKPNIKVQITLLDPFIPGAIDFAVPDTHLERDSMSAINEFPGATSGSLFRLENYYAFDEAVGTNGTFQWRGAGLDEAGRQVGGYEFSPNLPQFETYKGHSGPIQYYADTVYVYGTVAAAIPDVFYRLASAGLESESALENWGWRRSIFYREPVIKTQPQQPTAVVVGGSVSISALAVLRGTNLADPVIAAQWQESTDNVNWTPAVETAAFTDSFSKTVSNITQAQIGRYYRVVAKTDAGYAPSNSVRLMALSGTTAPIAPSNLIATTVSSSQINLGWSDNSNNETGFKLQRRLSSSSSWTDLPSVGTNIRAFPNTSGLSPNTGYVYRVGAINAANASNPAWSNEASARTSAVQTGNITLTVYAVDNSGALLIPLNVSIATWTGVSDNYANLTTAGANGFTRQLPAGTTAWFSAPQTLSDGRRFQFWLFGNGATAVQSTQFVTNFPLTANTTAFAHYVPASAPVRTLTSLAIEGPSSVDENDSETYKARATFSDGTSALVSASAWDITSGSSYADISSGGVLDAEAVSSDKSVTVSASYTAGGVTRTATKSVTIRDAVSTQTYTLTRNVVGSGEIGYSPHASTYAAGTVVSLHANDGDGSVFSHWTGDASGTEDDITIRMDGNRSVTAHFVVDTSYGNLRVDLSPPQAVAEGAAWRYNNFTAWRPSGDLQDGITPRTDKTIYFKDIPGWITPDSFKASVIGGQTTLKSATYREILGAVQVTITPAQAAQAGARWRLQGETVWRESGQTVGDVSPGNRTIEYLAVSGWTTPPAQAITVARGLTTARTGDYGPPAGFPIVASVAPRTGPIAGGTTVTFEGANFQPGATVTFGGVPATSVTVVSGSKITAVTPPRASYGTVAIALTSAGQPVPLLNGFSYLEPLGQNMELVSQLGGEFKSVDVQGTYAYVGEGASFVVMDITNPPTPVERGRIALPSFVESISVSGGKAYVATGSAGLYILDVSNPAVPSILGFFDTVDYAYGVAVDGIVAYVACSAGGLYILNVSDANAPILVATLDTPGRAERVSVATIAGRKYAFIADTSGGTRLVDVTVTTAPTEVSSIAAQNAVGTQDLKVVGTTLYVGGFGSGVQVFDITNPTQPVLKGAYTNTTADCLDVAGTTVYVCDGLIRILNASNPATPSSVGYLDLGSFPAQIRVAGGYAFIAFGREGFKVVSITTPSTPVLRATVKGIGRVDGLALKGTTVITGNDDGGFDTVDVSNPARPVALAHLGSERISNIVVTGNTAVLVNYGDDVVSIVDVGDPVAPVLRSTYTALEAWGIGLLGTSPVLTGATIASNPKPKVTVLNVTTPASPQVVGSLQLSTVDGTASDIAFAGNWGFVARPQFGATSRTLDIVNFVTPSNPQLITSYPLPGNGYKVAVSGDGNYAYLSGDSGFRIVDTRVKTAPVLVATIDPPQTLYTGVNGVLVNGSRLFVDDGSFVYLYDITNPASPTQVAYYDVPRVSSYGTSIYVNGDLLFVAGDDAGLTVLRLKDTDKPTVTIISPTTNPTFPTTSALLTLGGTATDLQGVVRVTWENDRGGGGVAQGTNAWTIPNLQLAAGVNVLTVTAEDAQGNLARDSITVTATLPETDGPALLVTGPQPPPAFTFTAPTLALTGTTADVSGVQSVAWANDRGGSGPATGTTAWSAAIPLFDGPNRITLTARDTAGNASQTEVLVTYLPPDTTAPTVGITFPTDAQEAATGDPMANLSGEADDDRAVARVTWTNSRGGSGEATGGRVWFANGIVLQPGVNLLTVTAYDAADNARSDTLSVTYTLPLTVTPGAGANGGISPNGPQTVNHGGSVFFTGTPSAGWQVGPWLVNGVAVQNGGTIFTLSDVTADATVQVTFTPVPVTPFVATRIFLEPVVAPGTGTQARMIFTGLAGRVYRVEFADSLATDSVGWQLLGTATADALGEFQFVDPPPLPPRRFYRAILPVTAPTIGMQRTPAPGVGMRSRLAFPGIAGRTYRVECTADLTASPIQWQTLGTATADGAGEVQFVDPAPQPSRRFYRAVER